ncbi:hypothetical protein [Pigmentiphaga litoralis]|uniref:hypothetical protein n=1 Tax=Pigmentiphaga litoralis TaxID=516702 RepID=UPI001675EBD4|nr:hypothetical protein [Pigmentiphaga litoralis]
MNVVVGKRRDDVAHERDQMQRLLMLPGGQITPLWQRQQTGVERKQVSSLHPAANAPLALLA